MLQSGSLVVVVVIIRCLFPNKGKRGINNTYTFKMKQTPTDEGQSFGYQCCTLLF